MCDCFSDVVNIATSDSVEIPTGTFGLGYTAGSLLRTSTRPTFNLPLLRTDMLCMSSHPDVMLRFRSECLCSMSMTLLHGPGVRDPVQAVLQRYLQRHGKPVTC